MYIAMLLFRYILSQVSYQRLDKPNTNERLQELLQSSKLQYRNLDQGKLENY